MGFVRVSRLNLISQLDELIDGAAAGNPEPVARAFLDVSSLRAGILRRLLEQNGDAPIAACFALIWQRLGPDMPDGMLNLLRWYLRAESTTRFITRQAIHRDTLTRLLSLERLPATDEGFDLAFVAVRVAVESDAPLRLHSLATGFLARIVTIWRGVDGASVRPSMLYAAIMTIDLGLLRHLLDRVRDQKDSAEIQQAFDWGVGVMMVSAGIDPGCTTSSTGNISATRPGRSPPSAKRSLGCMTDWSFPNLRRCFMRSGPMPPTHI